MEPGDSIGASLGFGLARPGFTAGASLAVDMGEQARAAWAIAAVNGINVVLAPLFMSLYRHMQAAPFLLSMLLLIGMLIYTLTNRQLKNAEPEPVSREAATMATLEKSDEGGSP